MEKDPNGKNPHEPGAKLDAGKAPVFRGLLDYFPRACIAVSEVSGAGAEKYAWKGWEDVPDGYLRYQDALARHQVKKGIEGPWDSELAERGKRILHDAQIAWNALASLELYLREEEQRGKVEQGNGSGNQGTWPVAKRLSELSAPDPFADSRLHVFTPESGSGSGGTVGGGSKGTPEGSPGRYQQGPTGVG